MYDSPRTGMDTITKLDYGDRWLRDGLRECGSAGAVEAIDVDVTMASMILNRLKSADLPITWTHVFVRAAAMVLHANPDLHQAVSGNHRVRPSAIDICLSVGGDSSVTPVVVIEDAVNKDLKAIAAEIIRRAPGAKEDSRRLLNGLRRFGWMVPLSGLRRALIRFLLRQPWYRRKVSGTFQVTCMPHVDFFAPFLFNTVAALGVGRVGDRVVACDGQAVVRPTVTLSCCFDHAIWNGGAAARFLNALRENIEAGEFAAGLGPIQGTLKLTFSPAAFTATSRSMQGEAFFRFDPES